MYDCMIYRIIIYLTRLTFVPPYCLLNFVRAGDAVDSSYAEQTSGFETRQVLGYLWTKELLKKHQKTIPKKLQSIKHQGKTIKGAILEENVVGSLSDSE